MRVTRPTYVLLIVGWLMILTECASLNTDKSIFDTDMSISQVQVDNVTKGKKWTNKAVNCVPRRGLNWRKCRKLASQGCPVSWIGRASCPVCGDGGCQLTTFCGFGTARRCRQYSHRGCRWTGLFCFGPTLKPSQKPSSQPTRQPTNQPVVG